MRELQGIDALNKVNTLMESMKTGKKVDSFSNVESIHLGYDGKLYGILKENTAYVLKLASKEIPTTSEHFQYINGIQNKSRFSKNSINETLKMFNLMNIEFKRVHGTQLMTEAIARQEVAEQKSVLKIKKKVTQ